MNTCVRMHSSHIKINAGGKGPNGFTYYFCELKSSHKFCGQHPKSKVININESTSRHLQDWEGVFITYYYYYLPGKMDTQQIGLETPPILTPSEIPQIPGSIYPRRRQTEEKRDRGCGQAGDKGLLSQKPL